MTIWREFMQTGAIFVLMGLLFEPSLAQASETIQIRRGFSQILRLDQPAQLVSVGDPKIADVTLGTGNTILVLTGKKIGATNLIVLGQNSLQIYDAAVEVGPDDDRLRIRVRYSAGSKSKDPGSAVTRTFLCDSSCEEDLLPPSPPATSAEQ